MGIEDRFFSQVEYSTDCWNWVGPKCKKGYGSFCIKQNGGWRSARAHRWSYEYFIGPLKDLFCLHHCDNPSCVNPFHLYAGTANNNMRDCLERGRHPLKNKTECARGHKFTEETTYYNPTGHRSCIICRRKALIRFRNKGAKSDGE